jgi:hypothetical protein
VHVVDQTPRSVRSAPFASETGVQEFVEEHAVDLLGVRVIASSRPGGRCLHKIDILAEAPDGRPWIIECKHDLVDGGTLSQLRNYRDALLSGWTAASARFGKGVRPDPLLVAIGYRFDALVLDGQLVPIAYRYHNLEFAKDHVLAQTSAEVSLYEVGGDAPGSLSAHPKVSKKDATIERLARLAPSLAGEFWQVDEQLRGWSGVTPKHGGKNFVRYSTKKGVFAEAVIGLGTIEWRITVTRPVREAADTTRLLTMLQDAYKAG